MIQCSVDRDPGDSANVVPARRPSATTLHHLPVYYWCLVVRRQPRLSETRVGDEAEMGIYLLDGSVGQLDSIRSNVAHMNMH